MITIIQSLLWKWFHCLNQVYLNLYAKPHRGQAIIVKDRTNHTMCFGLKRWTSRSCVNHKVKRERKVGAGNESDIFHRLCWRSRWKCQLEWFPLLRFALHTMLLHLCTLSLWESFKSGLISLLPSVFLSLSLSYSPIHFYTHPHTHTFLSVTNEPAVKLMFCNHRANCRYPISAPTAANALDLSLGVHLKNLRESWSQWSEGKKERKLFHQQPSLSIRPLSQKGLQLLCNSPQTFYTFLLYDRTMKQLY